MVYDSKTLGSVSNLTNHWPQIGLSYQSLQQATGSGIFTTYAMSPCMANSCSRVLFPIKVSSFATSCMSSFSHSSLVLAVGRFSLSHLASSVDVHGTVVCILALAFRRLLYRRALLLWWVFEHPIFVPMNLHTSFCREFPSTDTWESLVICVYTHFPLWIDCQSWLEGHRWTPHSLPLSENPRNTISLSTL